MAANLVPIGEGRSIPVDTRVEIYTKSYVGGREAQKPKPHREMKVSASVLKVNPARPKVRMVEME